MAIHLVNKWAFLSAVSLSVTACSIVDKSDDYQLSQSNDKVLIVPEGSVTAKDSLVIPHEDEISNISQKAEFSTPVIPESYQPLADLTVSWEDNLMWIETPLDVETSRIVVKNFLASLYGEGNPIDITSDSEIVSVPMGAQDQGALLSLYYNITRLYPDQTVYRLPIESNAVGTKVGFQHRSISKDQNKVVSYGDWLSPKNTDENYAIALQLLSVFSRESLGKSSDDTENEQIWLSNNGRYVLKLNGNANESDVASLVEDSDLYLISRNPLELAFVTEGEITKVGDIKPLTLPSTTEGGEDIVLLNLRYRNLNGVSWQKRVYPVDLVQRSEGLFVEVDTSATEQPGVVSYRIMSALKK